MTRCLDHTDPRSCDLLCRVQEIDRRVEELERIVHPEGRCDVCGGGKQYWRHSDARDGWHPFTPEAVA